MKNIFKILLFLIPVLFIGCTSSDDRPEPPIPKEKVIESTEAESSKLIMLGYLDGITAGGTLQPEGFATPVSIKDRTLNGTDYSFAVCSGVSRLDAIPDFSTVSDWKEALELTEGITAWIRYTSAAKFGYIKLRVAYINGNKVGVEYKVSSLQKRPDINDIGITESGAKAFVLKGYTNGGETAEGLLPEGLASRILIGNKEFKGVNYGFAKYNGVSQLSALPDVSSVTEWKSAAAIAENTAYWVRYATPQEFVYIKLRVAYIDGDDVGVEYKISSRETLVNTNANVPMEGRPYVTDYSIPHLNPANYYVEHTVSVNNQTVFNYALEWNDTMKHSEWVAFVFDKITKQDNVSRTDAWDVDPQLPKEMQVDNASHRNDGFDRGHICASEDRVYSKDANKQTFYYSNMSPQLKSFNGGFWAAFEDRVRKWGRNAFEKLYVVKGGTLNKLLVNYTGDKKGADGVIPKTDEKGRTIHGLACPMYYYMAVLGEKDGKFCAIGFWIEHRDDYGYEYRNNRVPADVLQKHAVSIDVLEQNTGIDFFCNLPDVIEDKVESAYSLTDWSW